MGNSKRLSTDGLLKMIWISLILHVVLVTFFSLTPWPKIIRAHPQIYAVSLMTVPLPEPKVQKPLPPPPPPPKVEKSPPADKVKPIEKVKKEDIVEKVKKPPKKIEKPEERKVNHKHLEEALEEIRKKAALDRIKRKLARREETEEKLPVTPPIVPVTPTPQASRATDERIKEYYSRIWAKIKGAWTIPENLSKEVVDLEAVLVVIIERDGTIRKWWFEKKSGHDAYDQTVVRAIMKADPLPPIPRDLSEESMEIGLRFSPD